MLDHLRHANGLGLGLRPSSVDLTARIDEVCSALTLGAVPREAPSVAQQIRAEFHRALLAGGATCPECSSVDTSVWRSRREKKGLRRRWQCHGCGGYFTTIEQVAK